MQAPESYNLTQLMDQIKAGSGHPSDYRNTIERGLLDPGARPSAPFRVSSY